MNSAIRSTFRVAVAALTFATFASDSFAQAVVSTAAAPSPAKPGAIPSASEVAAPSGLAQARTEDAVVLSPFEVTAGEDRGYQAISTVGGTRLRTDLKDLAASISVVTKDLMNDLGVDNLDVLAPYVLGAEVGGLNGNFSDSFNNTNFTDFDGQRRNLTPNIRLRGLAVASRTRDYFLTDLPGDGYNIERVEIQRGPNGMLYGLGSPSGVVNDGLIRANPQRTRTSVSTRFDNYGSYRGALDHNQVLVKDRLAVRLASVYNQSEYQIEEAFSLERRAYGTITSKPFAATTVRVAGEVALVRANPAQFRAPIDAFSYWWDTGKPVYNALTNTFSFLGTPPVASGGITGLPQQFLVNFQHRGNNPSIIVGDPNTGAYGLQTSYGFAEAAELMSNRVYRNAANTAWVNTNIYSTSRGDGYIRAKNGGAANVANNFWRIPQIADPAVFDFFHHQLDGPNRSRDGRWKTWNFAVEQRLGRNAGVEVAYDRQYLDHVFRDLVQFNRYTLNLDVTTILDNGSPNPNFGKVFFADGTFAQSQNRRREAFRATGYYDFDTKRLFREGSLWAKLLGRHTLTSNWTEQDSEYVRFAGNDMFDLDYYNVVQSQNAGTPAVANIVGNGQRQVNGVYYLSPNISGAASPRNAGIQQLKVPVLPYDRGVKSLSLLYHRIPPAASTTPIPYAIRTFNLITPEEWNIAPTANSANHTYDKYKALSAVVQSRWLDDTLVTTLGWRRDWVRTYDSGGITFDAVGKVRADDATWPLKPVLDQRHDAFNYGLVLRVPRFVTRRLPKGIDVGFLYNKSDNFTPQRARFSVYGERIDPTAGETKEYGLTVSLFDRKIDLRVSKYESASALATNTQIGSAILDFDRMVFRTLQHLEGGLMPDVPDNVKKAYIDFLRSPAATPFYNQNVAGYSIDANGHPVGQGDGTIDRVYATSDNLARGIEFEVTANPTRNWRITANVAKQESILSNSGNELWALLQSWRPYLVDGIAGEMQVQDVGGTWRQRFLSDEATTRRIRALDGSINPEVRQWRVNFITNYSFSGERLKGWSIGGAYRWQDKAAIGYPAVAIPGANPQYDVTAPYYAPTEANVDGWLRYSRRIWNDKVRWNAQVNVRNIGQKNKLIAATAQPDGSIDAWRVAADTSWTFSNSFEF